MEIFITGVSRGIGFETLRRFAADKGNRIFALSRNIQAINGLIDQYGSDRIIPIRADLSSGDFSGVVNTLETAACDHLDVVIHNAGTLIKKPFEQLTSGDWETTYRTNIIGPAMLTASMRRWLGGHRHTHLIMIGSVGGITGSSKFPGLTAYSSSKGALGIFAECLAAEFTGRNISVNCLALGAVQTEMLSEAFPGYRAPAGAADTAGFIHDFALNGWKHLNGVTVPVRKSNP